MNEGEIIDRELRDLLVGELPLWPSDSWLSSPEGRLHTLATVHEVIARHDDAQLMRAVGLLVQLERQDAYKAGFRDATRAADEKLEGHAQGSPGPFRDVVNNDVSADN